MSDTDIVNKDIVDFENDVFRVIEIPPIAIPLIPEQNEPIKEEIEGNEEQDVEENQDFSSKDKKKQSFKEYYDSKPEFRKKHREQLREKIVCECGSTVSKGNIYNHRKSNKHVVFMAKIKELTEKKPLKSKKKTTKK